ncbi:MAG: hypothetical protein ACMXYB_04825 [Candidatus Woesearchaeota archaeon]
MVIQTIIEALVTNFETYYGLDWLAIIFGVVGYLYITEKKAVGFLLRIKKTPLIGVRKMMSI